MSDASPVCKSTKHPPVLIRVLNLGHKTKSVVVEAACQHDPQDMEVLTIESQAAWATEPHDLDWCVAKARENCYVCRPR